MGTQLQTARPRRPRALRQATQFPAPPRQFAQRSQPQHGSQGRSPYAPPANAPQCAWSTARANGRRSSARANEDCHPSVPADAEESGVRAGLAPPLRCLRDGVADDVVDRAGLVVLGGSCTGAGKKKGVLLRRRYILGGFNENCRRLPCRSAQGAHARRI